MTAVTAANVRSFVGGQLSEPLLACGLAPDDLPLELDLLAEGVIDSFGFLELVLALEERYGVELDLEELDADDLTLLGPFSAAVARQAAETHEVVG